MILIILVYEYKICLILVIFYSIILEENKQNTLSKKLLKFLKYFKEFF